MAPSTPLSAPHQCARRICTALRSPRPSSVVAVTLALLLGDTGIADAASGGNFLLGKANSETVSRGVMPAPEPTRAVAAAAS